MSATGVSESEQQREPAAETDKQGSEETSVEGKAPVHDASDAVPKPSVAKQSTSKADLAKTAQTLREDANEGEMLHCVAV